METLHKLLLQHVPQTAMYYNVILEYVYTNLYCKDLKHCEQKAFNNIN